MMRMIPVVMKEQLRRKEALPLALARPGMMARRMPLERARIDRR